MQVHSDLVKGGVSAFTLGGGGGGPATYNVTANVGSVAGLAFVVTVACPGLLTTNKVQALYAPAAADFGWDTISVVAMCQSADTVTLHIRSNEGGISGALPFLIIAYP